MDSTTRLSRLLINRDFALMWSGQAVSALGDAVFTITLVLWTATSIGRGRPWVVLAVSGLSLAVAVPELVVGPLAGVFADRWNARTTMLRMDFLRAALIILLLPLPALSSTLPAQMTVGAIYAVLAGVTICSQFFSPSRLALIGDVVPPMHRTRASSLSQVTLSLSLIAGPPLAAVLYFAVGVRWALLLNVLSFGVSFLAIWLVRSEEQARAAGQTPRPSVPRELAAGLRFTAGNRPMQTVIITVSVAMLGGGALNALGIFFVTRNLHAAPSSYGFLDGGYGMGVLAGAVISALVAQRLNVVRLFWLSVLLLGAMILVYSRLTAFWPAFLVLTAGGVPQATLNVAIAPIMLQVTPREMLGRVSAILNPTVSLASILSVLLAGALVSTVLRGFHAELLGVRFAAVDTVFTGAGVLLIVAGLYARVSLRTLVLPASGSPEKGARHMTTTIRDLTPDDLPFLRQMLNTALFWRRGRIKPPTFLIVRIPQVRLFHSGWGRPGDIGLVAEVDGKPVGVVWLRLFSTAEHGEGYVDDATPELVIAVDRRYRGQGIGRRLMGAIHERARQEGIHQISLSVTPANPAKRLYASLGYRDYHPEDGNERMLVEL